MLRSYWNGALIPEHEPWREVEGPWQQEPDKVQWVDEATGLPCLVVRAQDGHLCGYVGVDSEHPAHRLVWSEADLPFDSAAVNYSGPCEEGDEEYGVCHVPAPGESGDVWWFGFDCMHSWDVVPAVLALTIEIGVPDYPDPRSTYKTVEWVQQKCGELAAELASWSGGIPEDRTMQWLLDQLPDDAAKVMRAAMDQDRAL